MSEFIKTGSTSERPVYEFSHENTALIYSVKQVCIMQLGPGATRGYLNGGVRCHPRGVGWV